MRSQNRRQRIAMRMEKRLDQIEIELTELRGLNEGDEGAVTAESEMQHSMQSWYHSSVSTLRNVDGNNEVQKV